MTSAAAVRPRTHRTAPGAVVLSLSASFVLIGASVALYGPLTADLIQSGALSSEWGGVVVGVHSAGALTAVIICATATGPASLRWRPPVAALVLGSGSLTITTAGSTSMLLVGASMVGAGYGALASDLNGSALRRFRRGPVVVNGLNAAFGCGAVGAPLLLATTGARPAASFVAVAAFAFVVGPLLAVTAENAEPARPDATGNGNGIASPASQRKWPPLGRLVVVGAAAATEGSLVAWGVDAILADGGSVAAAAAAMSGHFAVFVLARLVCVPLSARLAPRVLLTGSLTLTAMSLAVIAIGPEAPLGLVAAGVVGAAFPNGLLWSLEPRCRPVSRTLGPPAVIMAAMVGGIVGPLSSGLAGDSLGTTPLAVTAVLAGAVSVALLTSTAIRLPWSIKIRNVISGAGALRNRAVATSEYRAP